MSFIVTEVLEAVLQEQFEIKGENLQTRYKSKSLTSHFHEHTQKIRRHHHHEHILQLKVVSQRQNNICGYHTFYNIYILMLAVQSEHPQTVLSHLTNRYSFWRSYHQMKRALLDEASKTNYYYPWDIGSINTDVIEREYAKFLIKNFFKTDRITDLPDMCLGSIKNGIMPIDQLRSVQQILENFQTKPSLFHSFLIGSGNHWLGYFINKHNTHIEAFVVDSRNIKFFHKSKEDLMKDVLKKLIKSKTRRSFTHSEQKFYVDSFHSSLLDSVHTIQLLYDVAHGKCDFVQECLLIELNGVIEAFHSIKNQQDLHAYFKTYNPSHHLHKSIIKILTHIQLTPEIKQGLISWKNHLKTLSEPGTSYDLQVCNSLIEKMEIKFKI